MTRTDLIQIGKQWLEGSPPPTESAPDLRGFSGGIKVCSSCASRIMGRGCDLKLLANKPVWEPETLSCDLCNLPTENER